MIESYLDGPIVEALRLRTEQERVQDLHALQPEEAAVVALIQTRLARAEAPQAHTRRPQRRQPDRLSPPYCRVSRPAGALW